MAEEIFPPELIKRHIKKEVWQFKSPNPFKWYKRRVLQTIWTNHGNNISEDAASPCSDERRCVQPDEATWRRRRPQRTGNYQSHLIMSYLLDHSSISKDHITRMVTGSLPSTLRVYRTGKTSPWSSWTGGPVQPVHDEVVQCSLTYQKYVYPIQYTCILSSFCS